LLVEPLMVEQILVMVAVDGLELVVSMVMVAQA